MEQRAQSSELKPGQETAPDLANGRVINGAYFSNNELEEFKRQDFLEPFAKMEDEARPRVDAVKFAQQYMPIILDQRGEGEKQDGVAAWLNMWTKEISENLRLGIVLVGEDGTKEYELPPPLGTIHTGNTGHPDSIEGRFAFLAAEKRRLNSAGRFVEARIYNAIQVQTEKNNEHADDWCRLLADTGHLDDIPELKAAFVSKEPTSVTRWMHGRPAPTAVTSMVDAPVVGTAPAVNQPSGGDAGEMEYD